MEITQPVQVLAFVVAVVVAVATAAALSYRGLESLVASYRRRDGEIFEQAQSLEMLFTVTRWTCQVIGTAWVAGVLPREVIRAQGPQAGPRRGRTGSDR